MNLQDEDECTRNKGIRIQTGKILKGTLNQAPMKIRVSSIPSKHQNVIFHAPSVTAFGNSQSRFFNNKQFTPSPGSYNLTINNSKISSKKGSGTFATTKKLLSCSQLLQCCSNLKKKINKSKSLLQSGNISQEVKAHDLFKYQIKQSSKLPGPGQYTQPGQITNRLTKTASTGNMPFKSKIQRFYQKQKQTPPVGIYNWQEQIHKPKTVKYSFWNKSVTNHQKQKYLDQIIGQKNNKKDEIGPGFYNPRKIQSQKSFKITQGIYDRFGQLKQVYKLAKQQKQPSTQKQKNYQTMNVLKRNQQFTSIFKSKTNRVCFQSPILMDPCIYNPKKIQKKSHLINFSKKWI